MKSISRIMMVFFLVVAMASAGYSESTYYYDSESNRMIYVMDDDNPTKVMVFAYEGIRITGDVNILSENGVTVIPDSDFDPVGTENDKTWLFPFTGSLDQGFFAFMLEDAMDPFGNTLTASQGGEPYSEDFGVDLTGPEEPYIQTELFTRNSVYYTPSSSVEVDLYAEAEGTVEVYLGEVYQKSQLVSGSYSPTCSPGFNDCFIAVPDPLTISNLPAETEQEVNLYSYDKVGNNATSPASYTFYYDSQDPQGYVVQPEDGSTVGDSFPLIELNVTDEGSGLDTSTFSLLISNPDGTYACSSLSCPEFDWSYEPDTGIFSFLPLVNLSTDTVTDIEASFSVDDVVGRTYVYGWSFTIDNNLPSISEFYVEDQTLGGPPVYTSNPEPDINITFDGSTRVNDIYLSSGSLVEIQNNSVLYEYSAGYLGDGRYTLTVHAQKNIGGSWSQEEILTRSFEIDSTLPRITLLSTETLTSEMYEYRASVSEENIETMTFYVNDVSYIELDESSLSGSPYFDADTGEFSVTINLTEDGDEGMNDLTLEVTDRAKNTASDTHTVELDTGVPYLDVDYPEDGELVNTARIDVRGSAEYGSEVRLFVNGNEVTPSFEVSEPLMRTVDIDSFQFTAPDPFVIPRDTVITFVNNAGLDALLRYDGETYTIAPGGSHETGPIISDTDFHVESSVDAQRSDDLLASVRQKNETWVFYDVLLPDPTPLHNSLYLMATDEIGNKNETVVRAYYDLTAPVVSDRYPVPETTLGYDAFELSLTISDEYRLDEESVLVYLDEGLIYAGDGSVSLADADVQDERVVLTYSPGFSEGTHEVAAYALDNAGNMVNDTWTFDVDLSAPRLSAESIDGKYFSSLRAPLSFSFDKPVELLSVSINGRKDLEVETEDDISFTVTPFFDYDEPEENSLDITARALYEGSEALQYDPVPFYADSIAPLVGLDELPDITDDPNVDISFTVDEENLESVVVQGSFMGSPVEIGPDGPFELSVVLTEEGDNEIIVTAYDMFRSGEDRGVISLDTVDPVFDIFAVPSEVGTESFEIHVSVSEQLQGQAAVTFDGEEACSLSNIPPPPQTAVCEHTISGASVGDKVIRVTGTDTHGNDGSAETTVYTDTVSPEIFAEKPKGYINHNLTKVSADFIDNSQIEAVVMTIDGQDASSMDGTFVIGSTTVEYDPASEFSTGEHAVQVTVTDYLGNSESSSWTFNVDPDVPPAPIITYENGVEYLGEDYVPSSQPSIYISFVTPDVVSLTEVRLDGRIINDDCLKIPGEPNDWRCTPQLVSDGSYELEIDARRMIGDDPIVYSQVATYYSSFISDTQDPVLELDDIDNLVSARDLNISGTYADTNLRDVVIAGDITSSPQQVDSVFRTSSIEDFRQEVTLTDEPEGKDILVTATDRAGNSVTRTLYTVLDRSVPYLNVDNIAEYVSEPELDITGTAKPDSVVTLRNRVNGYSDSSYVGETVSEVTVGISNMRFEQQRVSIAQGVTLTIVHDDEFNQDLTYDIYYEEGSFSLAYKESRSFDLGLGTYHFTMEHGVISSSLTVEVRGEDDTFIFEDVPLMQGYNLIDVEVTGGNEVKNSESLTTFYDHLPPEIADVYPQYSVNDRTPAIEARITDSISGVSEETLLMVLDGTEYTVDSPELTYDGSQMHFIPSENITEGYHDAVISVRDNAGHLSSYSWTFRVDTSIPVLYEDINSRYYEEGRPELIFSFADPANVTQVLVDGSAEGELTYSDDRTEYTFVPASLDEGSHEMIIHAKHLYFEGNLGTYGPLTFYVDSLPPDVTLDTIVSPRADPKVTLTASIVDENLQEVRIVGDVIGAPVYLDTSSEIEHTVTLANEGENTIRVIAEDHHLQGSDEQVVVLDTTRPSFTLSADPVVARESPPMILIDISSDEDISGHATVMFEDSVVCELTMRSGNDYQCEYQLNHPSVGDKRISVSGQDAVGNSGSSEITIYADTYDPEVLSSEPGEYTNDNRTRIEVTFEDHSDLALYELYLDASYAADLSGEYDETSQRLTFYPLYDLAKGDHEAFAILEDIAGNLLNYSWSFYVDPDMPPPPDIIVLDANYDGIYYSSTDSPVISISFETSDTIILDHIYVDATEINSLCSPDDANSWICDLAALDDDVHEISVVARREIGSGSYSKPATYTEDFVVDTMPPRLVADDIDGRVSDREMAVEGIYSDINIDELVFSGDITSEEMYPDLIASPYDEDFEDSVTLTDSDGMKTITVTASDKAGNTNSTDLITYLDRVPPSLTVDDIPDFVSSESMRVSGTSDPGTTILLTNMVSGYQETTYVGDDKSMVTAELINTKFVPSTVTIAYGTPLRILHSDHVNDQITYNIFYDEESYDLAYNEEMVFDLDVGTHVFVSTYKSLSSTLTVNVEPESTVWAFDSVKNEPGLNMLRISAMGDNEMVVAEEETYRYDGVAPEISEEYPQNYITDNMTKVSARVQDSLSGIDSGSVEMVIADHAYTIDDPQLSLEDGLVIYSPGSEFDERTYPVTLSVRDIAGSLSTSSWTFTLDRSVPEILQSVHGSYYPTDQPELLFGFREPANVTSVTVDSEPGTLEHDGHTSFTFTPQALSEGEHELMVYARHLDRRGFSAAYGPYTFYVDSVAPDIDIAPISSPRSNSSISLSIRIDDDTLESVRIVSGVMGAPMELEAEESIVKELVLASEGENIISVVAQDMFRSSQEDISVVLDTTGPVFTIYPDREQTKASPPPLYIYYSSDEEIDGQSVITFDDVTACTDDDTPVGPMATCEKDISHPMLGDKSIRIYGEDELDNFGEAFYSVYTDTYRPDVSITGPSAYTADSTPELSAEFYDNSEIASVIMLLDGSNIDSLEGISEIGVDYISFTPSSNLSDAEHVMNITVTDILGNSRSAGRTFTVDTDLPPEPSIDVEGEVRVYGKDYLDNERMYVDISFDTQDTVLVDRILLDSGDMTASCDGFNTTYNCTFDASEGSRKISVWAAREIGQGIYSETVEYSKYIVVDTMQPRLDLSEPDPITSSLELPLEVRYSDPNILFIQVTGNITESLHTDDLIPSSSMQDLDLTVDLESGDGRKWINVTAVDSAGNSYTEETSVMLDTQYPYLTPDEIPEFVSNEYIDVSGIATPASIVSLTNGLSGYQQDRLVGESKPVVEIDIRNAKFEPSSLTVPIGTDVIIRHNDDINSNKDYDIEYELDEFTLSHGEQQILYLGLGEYHFELTSEDLPGITSDLDLIIRAEDDSFLFERVLLVPGRNILEMQASGANELVTPVTLFVNYDNIRPRIEYPEPQSSITESPEVIKAMITEEGGRYTTSGLDVETLTLTLDDETYQYPEVSFDTDWMIFSPQELEVGEHKVTVRVMDHAGNPAERSWTFVIDNSTPKLTQIMAGKIYPTDVPEILFGFDEPANVLQAGVVGSSGTLSANDEFTVYSFTPSSPLREGSHDFMITAQHMDGRGNVGEYGPFEFFVDSEAPIIQVSDPLSPTNEQTVVISGSIDDQNLEYARLEGDVFGSPIDISSFPVEATLMQEGRNDLRIVAGDMFRQSEQELFVDLDTLPPEYDVSARPDPATSVPLSIRFGVTEALEGSTDVVFDALAVCSRDDVPLLPDKVNCTHLIEHPTLGDKKVVVRGTDLVGNMGESEDDVYVDTYMPEIGNMLPSGFTNDNMTSVSAEYFDHNPIISVVMEIDGKRASDLPGTFTYSETLARFVPEEQFSDGTHRFTLRVTDSIGNVASEEWNVTVDPNIPNTPMITIDDANLHMGTYYSSSPGILVTMDFQTEEDVDVLQVAVDGQDIFETCEDEGLNRYSCQLSRPEGSYELVVVARKHLAPGVYSEEATYIQDFVVDTTAPYLSLDSVDGVVSDPLLDVSGSYSDIHMDSLILSGDIVEQVDHESVISSQSALDFIEQVELTTKEGDKQVVVTAKDLAGNEESSAIGIVFDRTIPYLEPGPISYYAGQARISVTGRAAPGSRVFLLNRMNGYEDQRDVGEDKSVVDVGILGTEFRISELDVPVGKPVRIVHDDPYNQDIVYSITYDEGSFTLAYEESEVLELGEGSYTFISDFGDTSRFDLTVRAEDDYFGFDGVELIEGLNIIRLTAVGDNEVESSDELSVVYDPTPAVISDMYPKSAVSDSSHEISASVYDKESAVADVTMHIDGEIVDASYSGGTISYSASLEEGTHVVRVTAENNAGLSSESAWTFLVDTSVPAMTQQIEGTYYAEPRPDLEFSYNSQVDVTASVDSSDVRHLQGQSFTYVPAENLDDGSHSLETYARRSDGTGNVGADSMTFYVDTISPTITIDNEIPQMTNTTSLEIMISGDEILRFTDISGDVASYGGESHGSAYFKAQVELAAGDGEKAIYVRSFDRAGRESATLERSVILDTTGPVVIDSNATELATPRPRLSFLFDGPIYRYDAQIEGDAGIIDVTETSLVSDELVLTPVEDLPTGDYSIVIRAEDELGNIGEEHVLEFSITIPALELELVDPRHGVTPEPVFDITMRTNRRAVCKYNINSPLDFEAAPYTAVSNGNLHMIYDYNFLPSALYVICKDDFGFTSQWFRYPLSLDMTPPVIFSAYADPETITTPTYDESGDGVQMTMFNVVTNEDSICRYSDSTVRYDEMEGRFEGYDEADSAAYATDHLAIIDDLPATQANYSYAVACENLAGNHTVTHNITFTVDLQVELALTITKPDQGLVTSGSSVDLEVKTNKVATCFYGWEEDVIQNQLAISADARTHTSTLTGLELGDNRVYVRCEYFDESDEDSVRFTVDNSPPVEPTITPRDYSCAPEMHASWTSEDEESGVESYYYAIGRYASIPDMLNWTETSGESATVSGLNISDGDTYYWMVKAENEVGLMSDTAATAVVMNLDDDRCRETTPPTVTVQAEDVDEGARVTLNCADAGSGCDTGKQFYGLSMIGENCTPYDIYFQPILVTEDSAFCYEVYDVAGNKKTGSQDIEVEVKDADEDGYSDSEDNCPDEYNPGQSDQDSDGVGDACDDDYEEEDLVDDLDGDGVPDMMDDDIDGDGLLNWEDPDDDNDGTCDTEASPLNEACELDDCDINGNMLDDADEIDADNDLDNDGEENGVDEDDDGDQTPDIEDTDDDNDCVEDSLDDDDDNDGVLDIDDPDQGGTLATCEYDAQDPETIGCRDESNDLDGDGVSNDQDNDDDGDGTPDIDDEDDDNDGVLDIMDVDDDNDGIPDDDDWLDSDGDGIPDRWELEYGLNPDEDDSSDDPDADSLSNYEEYERSTHPKNSDTDGDSYGDGTELADGFDPLDPSSYPKSNILTMLLLILAILIVLGGGSYYGYVEYAKKKGPKPPKQPPRQPPKQPQQPSRPSDKPAQPSRPKVKPVDKKKMTDMEKVLHKRKTKKEKEREKIFSAFGEGKKEGLPLKEDDGKEEKKDVKPKKQEDWVSIDTLKGGKVKDDDIEKLTDLVRKTKGKEVRIKARKKDDIFDELSTKIGKKEATDVFKDMEDIGSDDVDELSKIVSGKSDKAKKRRSG